MNPCTSWPGRLGFACLAHAVGLGGRILAGSCRLFGRYRPLDPAERMDVAPVFDGILDLDAVRLPVQGRLTRLAWRLSGRRPFTTMHTIHHHPDRPLSRRTLVHELVHVWQAEQFGHRYMLAALWAQWFGEGYTVTRDHLVRWNGDLAAANPEQQAVVVERYWVARHGRVPGESADWSPYEPYVEELRRLTHATPT